MHNQIDRLKDGDERACDDCGKIFESSRFPYKSINLCLWCYEKKHKKRLLSLRSRLKIVTFENKTRNKKITTGIKTKPKICPNCQSNKIRKAKLSQRKHNKYLCKDCNEIWDSETAQENIGINQSKSFVKKSKCPMCDSVDCEKKGFRNKKQRYVCKDCGRNWTSGINIKSTTYKKVKKENNSQRENTLEEILSYLKKMEKNNKSLKFWYRNDVEPREIYDYFIDEKYVQVKSDKGYYIKFLIDKIRKI